MGTTDKGYTRPFAASTCWKVSVLPEKDSTKCPVSWYSAWSSKMDGMLLESCWTLENNAEVQN